MITNNLHLNFSPFRNSFDESKDKTSVELFNCTINTGEFRSSNFNLCISTTLVSKELGYGEKTNIKYKYSKADSILIIELLNHIIKGLKYKEQESIRSLIKNSIQGINSNPLTLSIKTILSESLSRSPNFSFNLSLYKTPKNIIVLNQHSYKLLLPDLTIQLSKYLLELAEEVYLKNTF